MAEQPWFKYPRTGWGTQLHHYLSTDKVKVINHARNGASTRSYRVHWKTALQSIRSGDIVVIGFAHNDEYYTMPDGSSPIKEFSSLLTGYIHQLKSNGAIVIAGTPVALYDFKNGLFEGSHGEYPTAIRAIAEKTGVQVLDLYQYSQQLLNELGEKKARELYLILPPGQFVMYPAGVTDVIHTSVFGAQVFAKYAAETINQLL